MMTTVLILAWLATGLGMGYGWSRDHIRANRAEQREGLLSAALDERDDELERAERGRKSAETEAATYLRSIGELAGSRMKAIIAADDLRAEMLPDLRRNYLDTVANLPVGWRLDWDAFDAGTPIGASVVETLAEVVPIRGLS